MSTIDEALDDVIMASATFTVLVAEFEASFDRPPPSSLTRYQENAAEVSSILLGGAVLLADAVTTTVSLLRDQQEALEARIVALEVDQHDHSGGG